MNLSPYNIIYMDKAIPCLQLKFMEKYKQHPIYKEFEVSNLGNVRRIGKRRNLKGKIDRDGYIEYHLKTVKYNYYRRGHRLVAETFIKNPKNKPVVNHKNGIKNDNRVKNLEWATVSENTRHSFNVLRRKGQNGGMGQYIDLYDLNNNYIKIFSSKLLLAKHIGLNSTTAITGYLKRAERLGYENCSLGKIYKAKLHKKNNCECRDYRK